MTSPQIPQRKKTRASKEASGTERVIKEKFAEERRSVSPLVPMNELQAEYIKLINSKPLVIASGFAGTSKCIRKNSLIRTEEGLTEIGDILDSNQKDGYFDIKKDIFGLSGKETATNFYVESMAEAFKVTTSQGYELVGTPEHPVLVFNGETHVFKKISELSDKDILCIDRNTCADGKDKEIDVSPFTVKKGTSHLKGVTYPKSMDENLAKWLGYVVANSAVAKNRLAWCSANKLLADNFCELTHKIFGVYPARRIAEGRNNLENCDIYSAEVVHFINEIFCGFKTARYKTIPKCVVYSSKKSKAAFITGLLDCDGSFYRGIMELSSASEEVARVFQIMLLDFGIISRRYGKTVKGMGDHKYWKIEVTSSDVDILFSDVIRSSIKYAGKLTPTKRNTNKDIIPGLKNFISEQVEQLFPVILHTKSGFYKEKDGTTLRMRLFSNQHMERTTSKEFTYRKLDGLIYNFNSSTPYIREVFKKYGGSIAYIQQKHFFYDTIKSVEFEGFETVYDLTVPGSHSFISNGIVSHNTYVPTVMACDKLRNGEIDKIYLTRPNVSNSKSLGYFSGDLFQKLQSWLMPVLSTLYERLGRGAAEVAIKNGDITFVPLETIKGMSFGKRTFVLCDEAEDITVAEAKSIVTRQGGGAMVLAGDVEQSALSEKSGLSWLIKMVEKHPELEDTTGFVDFNRPSDIVRSDSCKQWILAMRRDNE